MDNKKIIIIGIFLIIIAGAALVILTTTVNYERIEITPNGTSIEIPTNHQKYLGDYEGVKVWKWNYGALASYNSEKITNNLGLSGLSLNALNNIIKNGNSENIDGFTCYTLNANELLDYLEIKYNGNFYCIPLANETTHDNVIICCSDKDIALHIAKSVEYKTSK